MTARNGALRIVPVQGRRGVRDWLDVPHRVFAGDPAWIAPLRLVERRRISPAHAPLFSFGRAALFLAYRGGIPVGRISAQVNLRHLAFHNDNTGHFGFFDCLDDVEAAGALVSAAADWLRAQGMTRMEGPLSFTINEECGCLVGGFGIPPVVMMGHARPFTGGLLEAAGLAKKIDLYTYRVAATRLHPFRRLARFAGQLRDVSVRPFELGRYDDELETLLEIFNDSWSGNWGFVPLSREEIRHLGAGLRPFLRNEYGRFLLIGGQPAGVMLGLPDVNGIIASFGGRLLPFNWLKLIWALRRETSRGARMLLVGLKRVHQSSPRAGALLALLAQEVVEQRGRYGVEWLDLGWVLETNRRVTRLAEAIAGPPSKTYRIYAAPL